MKCGKGMVTLPKYRAERGQTTKPQEPLDNDHLPMPEDGEAKIELMKSMLKLNRLKRAGKKDLRDTTRQENKASCRGNVWLANPKSQGKKE